MRSFVAQFCIVVFVLGTTICPCAAQTESSQGHHQHGSAYHVTESDPLPSCHSELGGSNCASMLTTATAQSNTLAISNWPTPEDDDGEDFTVKSKLISLAHHGGSPPRPVVHLQVSTPTTLKDRLIE